MIQMIISKKKQNHLQNHLAFQLGNFVWFRSIFLGFKKAPHNSTFEPSKLPSPQAEDHEHTDLELHHFHKISTGLKPPVVSQKNISRNLEGKKLCHSIRLEIQNLESHELLVYNTFQFRCQVPDKSSS